MKQLKTISLPVESDSSAALVEEIISKFKVSPVLARILVARGFKDDQALEHFLQPTLQKTLLDPTKLKNLFAAAELITEHIKAGHKLSICSDFDVDGLTSASQLKAFFNQLNLDCLVQVPDRFKDGYGLNLRMIDAAKEYGASLLIALDYGTTNQLELAHAREQGIQTIVIDHHHVSDQMKTQGADVFVNPQQAGCNFAEGMLCTAGLAWYLLIALKKTLAQTSIGQKLKVGEIDLRTYLDLACLGTICDMVPLIGVNRLIAKKGLEQLTVSKRAGIKAMKRIIGIKDAVASHHVGFGFGPRINAAGRMMQGDVVVELLSTKDIAIAEKIAGRLNVLNSDRQEIEKKIRTLAEQQVEAASNRQYGLSAWGDDFHTGVIGIVAQRLSEKFYRPSIVMGSDSDVYKGSVRGIKGFSVVEALNQLAPHFSKFGGHPGAGGFSLNHDRITEFANDFDQVCKKLLKDVPLVPTVQADALVSLAEIDEHLVSQVAGLQPFGLANPGVNLLLSGVTVREVSCLKNAHLKLTLSDGKRYLTAFFWQLAHHPALFPGAKVRVVGKPEINDFQGSRSVQFNLVAAELAGKQ